MKNRALMGWLLVGAFCASVSCGNDGNNGVPGYGLACMSDKDCTSFSLLCDESEERCVQCLGSEDCKPAEECLSGLCKSPQQCEDSRDCDAGTVCNAPTDCCAGTTCTNGRCCAGPNGACIVGSDCCSGTCRSNRTCV